MFRENTTPAGASDSAKWIAAGPWRRKWYCWLGLSLTIALLGLATACGGGGGGGGGGDGGGIAPSFISSNHTTFTSSSFGTFSVAATGTPAPALQMVGSLPAGIGFVDDGGGNGTLSGIPASGTEGTYNLMITANNGVQPNSIQSFTLTVSQANAAIAQLVQHVSSSNTRNNGFSSPYCYHYQLPNFTTAGNAVVVGFTFNSNPTPSVSDDGGNSYSVQVNYFDSADTQSIGIATAFNIAAGARVISVCFSSNPGGFVQPMATEFDNVIGVDGAGTGSKGIGTSVTAGSMTPSVSGDLAYQVVYSLSTNQSSFTGGSQSNISWGLLSADLMDGWAAQYGIYNSTSAVNPTLAMGTSQKWVSAGILLKTGVSGAVPSGMRIVHLVHENLPVNVAAGGTGNPFANPTVLQFPSAGNLLVAMLGGGLGCTVTSMTDTNQNGWSQAGAIQIQAAGNDTVQTYYAGNATTSSDLELTVNWTATIGDFTIFLYDVAGAAALPLDTTAGGTGSQATAGNLTMPFTITPADANELIFTDVIWDFNTGSGLAGPGQFFDTNTYSGEDINGPEPIDQNNGWGHVIATNTAPVGFTWVPLSDSLNVGNWAGMAAAFKAAP